MSIPEDDLVRLTARDVDAADLADWRPMFGTLHARFRAPDFSTGARFVTEIAAAADAADHHPDVDLRYGFVHVRTWSHDIGGLTRRDLRLAQVISELAASGGLTADPAALDVVEWALDTPDHDAVRPFWAAVLGLRDTGEDEVRDPSGRRPAVWFQAAPEPGPQRWHPDVRVPPEQAQARIAAALAAGGRLVSDERAPAFWVLEDPQGNRACITTWQGRD